MGITQKKILFFPFIILSIVHLTACAQVLTGAAVKVATVSQEERSIGEYVDDAIIMLKFHKQEYYWRALLKTLISKLKLHV